MDLQIGSRVVLVEDFLYFESTGEETVYSEGTCGTVTNIDDMGCDVLFDGASQSYYVFDREIELYKFKE